jgi:hypothetical protein
MPDVLRDHDHELIVICKNSLAAHLYGTFFEVIM